MGKKYWRCNPITIQGEACHLETWHTDDGWFHTKRHSKCTHLATGMAWEGFNRDCYAAAESQAKNEANNGIGAWLAQKRRDEEARRMAQQLAYGIKCKAQEEARKREAELNYKRQKAATEKAQEEARKREAELKRQKAATEKAQAEARARAEQLRLQKGAQRQQLTRTINALSTQLQQKQSVFDAKHSELMDIARQIAVEEKEIEAFRMERSDNSNKIMITLGATGGGKSTFCNRMWGDTSLFGDDEKSPCATSGDSKSCTQDNCKLVVQIGSERITMIDTPGFGDSFGRDRQHGNRLCAYLKGCGGINAFVLVRNGTQPRFDQAFQEMLKQYHEMFGEMFFKRLIIVATRIDSRINKMQFDRNKTDRTLRSDICAMFNLNEEIPVIPIGLQSYEDSIAKLVDTLPDDKWTPRHIKSPIDGLKARHSAVQSQENTLRQQMSEVQVQINTANSSLNAL
eukprot:476075_1